MRHFPIIFAGVSILNVVIGLPDIGLSQIFFMFMFIFCLKIYFSVIKEPGLRMDVEGFHIMHITGVLHLRWEDIDSLSEVDYNFSYRRLLDGQIMNFNLSVFAKDTRREVRDALLEGYQVSQETQDPADTP